MERVETVQPSGQRCQNAAEDEDKELHSCSLEASNEKKSAGLENSQSDPETFNIQDHCKRAP